MHSHLQRKSRRRIALCLTLGATVAGASVEAHGAEVSGVSAAARPIYPNMAGYNSDYYYTTNPWSLEKRRQAAVKSRPGLLRYPGGTSANYWDAYRSRIFHDVAAIDPGDGNPAGWTQTRYTINWMHNAFFWTNVTPLSDFKLLHSDLQAAHGGADTIFVANMITPGADFYSLKWNRAIDRKTGSDDWWAMMGARYGAFEYMLDDAAKNGLPVKYVELGNEYYFGAGITRAGKPADVEPYSAGGYAEENKFDFENIGTFPDKSDGQDSLYFYGVAANDWGAKVKQKYPNTKVCAVGALVGDAGATGRTATWNQQALAALDPAKVDAISLHLYGGPQTGSLTETEEKLGSALKSWREFWVAGVKRSHLPEKFDWWLTEFNIDDEFGQGDKLPENKGTWGNGLGNIYCLNYLLANEPRVKVVLVHELARVIVADGPDIKAHGRAYGLFAHALTGRTRAQALSLQDVPSLQGSGDSIKGIVGWKFDAADNSKSASYALVNFSGSPQTLVGLPKIVGTKGQYIQASAKLNTLLDPGETTGKASDLLKLPPYSVTVVEEPPGK